MWSFQQNGSNPNLRIVDLRLCMVWPWQGPQKRSSILQSHVIKCQPYEICTPEPHTQIYGLGLGYIHKHFLLNQDFFESPSLWLVLLGTPNEKYLGSCYSL